MASLFFVALFSSIVSETIVLFFFIKLFHSKENTPLRQIVDAGILASSLTLPYLWFIVPQLLPEHLIVPLGETAVVLVEAGIINLILRLGVKKSFAVSLLANLTSWGLSMLY